MATTPHNPRPTFEEHIEDGRRELVMIKNGHRYVFRCALGHEADMLRQLGEMIRSERVVRADGQTSGVELDWFDAAVISHQIGQRMAGPVNRTLRKAS